MGLGIYILSKEKINETKKLQIVVKLRNFDIIKKIDIKRLRKKGRNLPKLDREVGSKLG
jgi:hypothetical protein